LSDCSNVLEIGAREPHPQITPRGRPNPQVSEMTHPEAQKRNKIK
jgi:hypothetical protein